MKIIVTGAAGFIGSHLCAHIQSTSHECIAIDRCDREETLQRLGLHQVTRLPQVHSINLCDAEAIRSCGYSNIIKADVMVHLAAESSVQRSVDRPMEVMHNNVVSFEGARQIALRSGVSKFIYASSSSVYGSFSSAHNTVNAPPRPKSIYAITKYLNETAADAHSDQKMRFIGLRFFNVYGKHMNKESAYASIIQKWMGIISKGGKTLPIHGDGQQRRDFTYVTDVVRGIMTIAENDPKAPIYNLGYGSPCSIWELLYAFRQIYETNFDCEQKPEKPFEVRVSGADMSQWKKEFKFSPEVDIMSGLRATIP